jgi:AhpD family alkylhydroperoxidase
LLSKNIKGDFMDEKTIELVAIGTSIGAHCKPCLEYHLQKAAGMGIDPEEIRQAVEIGHKVEKGSMAAMKKFSTNALDKLSDSTE